MSEDTWRCAPDSCIGDLTLDEVRLDTLDYFGWRCSYCLRVELRLPGSLRAGGAGWGNDAGQLRVRRATAPKAGARLKDISSRPARSRAWLCTWRSLTHDSCLMTHDSLPGYAFISIHPRIDKT